MTVLCELPFLRSTMTAEHCAIHCGDNLLCIPMMCPHRPPGGASFRGFPETVALIPMKLLLGEYLKFQMLQRVPLGSHTCLWRQLWLAFSPL